MPDGIKQAFEDRDAQPVASTRELYQWLISLRRARFIVCGRSVRREELCAAEAAALLRQLRECPASLRFASATLRLSRLRFEHGSHLRQGSFQAEVLRIAGPSENLLTGYNHSVRALTDVPEHILVSRDLNGVEVQLPREQRVWRKQVIEILRKVTMLALMPLLAFVVGITLVYLDVHLVNISDSVFLFCIAATGVCWLLLASWSKSRMTDMQWLQHPPMCLTLSDAGLEVVKGEQTHRWAWHEIGALQEDGCLHLHHGAVVALCSNQPPEHRQWLCALIMQANQASDQGTASEIPRMLEALQGVVVPDDAEHH